MYVLYEEDGDIKAGTILADNDSLAADRVPARQARPS
jgi:hypothetical protein